MKIIYTNPVFIDTAHSVMNEFRDDTSNTLLIIGAINVCADNDYAEYTKGYDRVIIYNQEPYDSLLVSNFPEKYMDWLRRADEVWDYTEENVQYLAAQGIQAKLHILKPYKNWDMYAPIQKDIDVLFIGTLYERRQTVIDFLRQRYNVVVTPDHTYGDVLDDYILRSKILLNIHGTTHFQEQARMVKWLGAPCQIISERSTHNYLNVPEMDYWELFCL